MSYATPAQLRQAALSENALDGVTEEAQAAALERASAVADGYIGMRFTVPLTSWGGDLVRVVCDIAAYDLLTQRPINVPAEPWTPRVRYEDAVQWLEKVSRGEIKPANVVTSPTPPRREGTPVVVSQKPRGW